MQWMLRWLRTHPWRGFFLALLVSFMLLNILAYRHARAMTHFVSAGERTAKPEALSTAQKIKVLFTGVHLLHPFPSARPEDDGLTSSVHTFDSSRGQLEAWFIPHPRPRGVVLMFHGFAACKDQLLPEAKAFHALGYACFLVDFPGSGGSTGDETTVGYHEAEDVDFAVKYVREQWPDLPIVLFGRSMGSAAILRALAVQGTRADVAILECPFDRMLSTVEARFGQMGVPAFPGADLLLFWGSVQLGFNAFDHNPADYATAVDCPVLLMHGDKDPSVSVRQTAAIFENLHGPKELATFPGLKHEAYLPKQPDDWKERVTKFLAEYLKPN